MAPVMETDCGTLDAQGYLDEVPERWALFFSAVAGYLELSEAEIRAELDAGKTLADLARVQRKDVDVLMGRVTAALQSTQTSLGSVFLNLVVEHLVDLPWAARPADLAG